MPEPVPAAPILRPFWLMRILAQSMRTGAYFTPRLYVPRALWSVRPAPPPFKAPLNHCRARPPRLSPACV
jgi:hypothetical protein